jgi:hypothetical protein
MKSAAFATHCHAAIIETWLSGNRGRLASPAADWPPSSTTHCGRRSGRRDAVTVTSDRARIAPAATR